MAIDKTEIERLTEVHGGVWGINHTRRLLHLVEQIGGNLEYDREAIWIAAHLHDWGAYAPWAQKGVDHVVRSLQVAEEHLMAKGCSPELKVLVLECIALHHKPGSDRSLEATLLRDADCLDFLGIVGVLRDFSKNPRGLRAAFDQARERRNTVPQLLQLKASRAIARKRVREMDALLEQFETESVGCF